MMNILLCGASMGIGGAETHMLTLARGLHEKGHRVTVAAERGELCDELKRLGIRFIRLPVAEVGFCDTYKAYSSLRRILKRWDFDVVHAHSRLTSLLVELVRKREGLDFRFIVTAHAKYKTTRALRLLSVWGDTCIAVSRDIKRHLVKNYRADSDSIKIIPNGIDTTVFHYGGRGRKRSVLFVSRLDGDCSKGAVALCRIAPRLCREFPDARITIAGGGSELRYISALAKRANRAAGRECVSVLGAVTDIAALIRESDCVVGVSRAAFEAMAMERPVILYGNEGALGLFDESKQNKAERTNFTGRGAGAALDDELLLSELRRAFTLDDKTRRRICKFGRELIEKKYSAESMTDRTLELYSSEPNHTTRVTVGGYYGFGNMGDDAVLSVLVSQLKRNIPGARITVLTRGGRAVNGVTGATFADRSDPLELLETLRRSDIYISGGGSLLQNKTSTRSLAYYCGILWLAEKLGNATVILSNGIGPLRGISAEWMAKSAISSARRVSVRDMDSFLKVMRLTRGRVCPRLSADMIFAADNMETIEKKPKSLLECGARYVAIALNGRDEKKNETVSLAVREYCRVNKLFPVFVSMDTKTDEASAKRCAGLSGGIYVSVKNAVDLRSLLRNSELAVGSRLHFLFFALLEGVPLVPIFSDPKVDSFSLEAIGTPALRVKEGFLEKLMRFVSSGRCYYDKKELLDSFSARAKGDLLGLCELCLTAAKENSAKRKRKIAPKPLKNQNKSAIINFD